MTYEEELMVQGLTDMVRSERKEKVELRALLEFATRPRINEYDSLYKEIERQGKIIEDQQKTIEGQKQSLREILFERL